MILRDPMDFMLPDDGVNKNYILAREDYYFVYPTRFHEYERQFRGSFQHGGISIEEMVLPLVDADAAPHVTETAWASDAARGDRAARRALAARARAPATWCC